jgi:aminoglycoside phosphotransferase (APT) family kinase protein
MSGDTNFSDTGAIRAGHRFDEAALDYWMKANIDGYAGPLTIEQFKGGQSNPTYKLITPRLSYVLRRKPPGPLLKGAHAIEREARVLKALKEADFPVPHIYGLCTNDDIIGTWFYVMELVEGRIFWSAALDKADRVQRRACFDAMNSAIAALHQIDPTCVGLDDYGRSGNYFERQIARWSKQYLADSEAGRDPSLDKLIDWLPDNVPEVNHQTSIIHGDFRIDNIIFHPSDPRIIAVLDWELSTLGNPLSDFAYHLMMYRMPQLTIPGLAGLDLPVLGIPTEAEYIADYCRRTGRAEIPDIEFYLAFNFFRFAAIIHGIKGRLVRGTAVSNSAESLVVDLPAIATIGWETAQKANGTR